MVKFNLYPHIWNKGRTVYLPISFIEDNPFLEDLVSIAVIKGCNLQYTNIARCLAMVSNKAKEVSLWNPIEELIDHLSSLSLEDIFHSLKDQYPDSLDFQANALTIKNNRDIISICLYKNTDVGPIYKLESSISEYPLFTLPCSIFINLASLYLNGLNDLTPLSTGNYSSSHLSTGYPKDIHLSTGSVDIPIDYIDSGYRLIKSTAILPILIKDLIELRTLGRLLSKYPYLFKDLDAYGSEKDGSYLIKAEHKVNLCRVSIDSLLDIETIDTRYPISIQSSDSYPLSAREIVADIIYNYEIPAIPAKYGQGNKPIIIGDGARAIGVGLRTKDSNSNKLPKSQWTVLNANAEEGPKALTKWLNRLHSNFPTVTAEVPNSKPVYPLFKGSVEEGFISGALYKCLLSNGRINGSGTAISHPSNSIPYGIKKTLKGLVYIDTMTEELEAYLKAKGSSINDRYRTSVPRYKAEILSQVVQEMIHSIGGSNREYGWNEPILTIGGSIVIKNIYPNQFLKVIDGKVVPYYKAPNDILEVSLKVYLADNDPCNKLRSPGTKFTTVPDNLNFYSLDGELEPIHWDIYIPQECQKGRLASLIMSIQNIPSTYHSDTGILSLDKEDLDDDFIPIS